MSKVFLIATGAFLAVVIGMAAAPQDPPVFRSQSELVVLHVMVKERHGAYVGGLTADAFQVFEDNRPQEIQFFASEDAPVTIGLIIDSSGSMAQVRDRIIAASAAFVEASNPQDEVFATIFNDDVRSVPDSGAHFVSDAAALRSLLADAFMPAGRTKLYDAVTEGLSYVTTGTRGRRVLVLLSDGGDNASASTFGDTLMLTQASNVVIYAVALVGGFDQEADPKRLTQLAEASGGASFSPRNVDDVDRAFRQIARDIRSSYTIGYRPVNTQLRPGLRRIRVEAHGADGRRLVTRTRNAYLAGQDSSFKEATHAR